MTVIGLVAEGHLDYPVIEALVDQILPQQYSRPIRFKYLQPEADSTTSSFRGGGWGRVVGWCKRHTGELIETHFAAMEDGDMPCDLIIVHLDGDAMIGCADHASKSPPPEPCHPTERISALKDFLREWLQLKPLREPLVKFALPTMHSEAWLLAALQPNVEDWEKLDDAKSPFRSDNPDKLRMKDFYHKKSVEAANNADTIIAQSHSFSEFHKDLTA